MYILAALTITFHAVYVNVHAKFEGCTVDIQAATGFLTITT